MRNRLFLLALVAVLLLVQAVLRTAAQATPLSLTTTWGGISFWELRGALPLGVFAAGIMLVCTAAMAQSAQAALRIAGRYQRLARNLGSIASAGLWCGAPLAACCLNALPYIFPWLNAYDPDGWQTSEHLEWALHGGIILLLISRLATLSGKAAAACFTLPAGLLCVLLISLLGFGHPLLLLPVAAMTTAGLTMLRGRGRRWAGIPLLTGIIMNAALFQLTASPVATIPAAWVAYATLLALLAGLIWLKWAALEARC